MSKYFWTFNVLFSQVRRQFNYYEVYNFQIYQLSNYYSISMK